MPLNDAHCHFFSPRFFETLARDAAGRFDADPAVSVPEALGWEAPGSVGQLANRWMAEIDRHQVQRAVLIASVPGDEQSVVEALATHPAAFVGFFMVNPLAESAIERGRRCRSSSRTSARASSAKRSWPRTCAPTFISTPRARIAG